MECRLAYSREWAIRMTHEQKMHKASSFLTLTFDDHHLPKFGQLEKKPLVDFFKRLRYYYGSFRYVACGEYGELHRRPHYHVALFGMDFSSDRLLYKESMRGEPLYTSSSLSRAWTAGNALLGALTFESAAYIARYITKRITGVGASPTPLACDPDTGELVMPNPEFLLCSRRPFIGHDFFFKYGHKDILPHGRVITEQGTPAPVPRAYKRVIANSTLKNSFAIQQYQNLPNRRDEVAKARLEDSPPRRAARTTYANARTGAFKRDITE